MKWLKFGLLWGGGVGFATLAVVLFLVWLSEPDDVAEFETAAGTSTAPPADQTLEVALRPYPIRVLASNGQTSTGFVSIRMVIDDASHREVVCHRLPKVREALTLSFGGKVLSREDWYAVTGRAMANDLRKRFNKALKANYVRKVIIDRGHRSGGKKKACNF